MRRLFIFHFFLPLFVLIAATAPMSAQSGFTVSATPSSLSIPQNGQGVSIVTTNISGGFNGSISLSASGLPMGVSVSFNPSTIGAPGAGSSTMTITVAQIARPGTYPITVTGTGGGIRQTATVMLTVTASEKPSLTVSVLPAFLAIAQGNQGTSTVYTIVGGGFSGSISLSASRGCPQAQPLASAPKGFRRRVTAARP